MNSRHRWLPALAGAAMLAALPAAAQPADATVRASFTASDAPFPNQERGFYRAGGRGNLDLLEPAFLDAAYRDGYRLIYARIDLAPYRTGPIPAEFLDKLNAGFAAGRKAGVKYIVRATYNYPRGETDYHSAQDAPLPVVIQHLEQLKPLLRENEDVIAFVQAGFIGAWGEWHSSSNGLAEPAARTAIKDALLAAVPTDRFVQFRYPPYLREWVPQPPSAAQAIASNFRIGFHNDCFMASKTDVGTYNEDAAQRAQEQDYTDRLGDAAPFGGETCNPADDPGATPRTTCADILREGPRYNLTYLNTDYYRRLFHNNWTTGKCYDQVAGHMGYRLRLVDVTHASRAAPGERLQGSLTIRNDGWARPFNPRGVELLLRARKGGGVRRLAIEGADARGWLPGSEVKVPLDVALPADLAAGEYDVLLALPDASAKLHDDARYAVRPANADDRPKGQAWDAELGAFRLGTRVKVAS